MTRGIECSIAVDAGWSGQWRFHYDGPQGGSEEARREGGKRICLAVNSTVQVIFSLTRLIKLLSVIQCGGIRKYFVSSPPILEQTLSSDFECSFNDSYALLHPSSVLSVHKDAYDLRFSLNLVLDGRREAPIEPKPQLKPKSELEPEPDPRRRAQSNSHAAASLWRSTRRLCDARSRALGSTLVISSFFEWSCVWSTYMAGLKPGSTMYWPARAPILL
ncbi:hypothetical protein SO802_017473 [Lithocarpus litseifolius]|uniref:Uncharacterized protein n=1 Tax=Lithocarpus litseifolius TaxID=425828 RepID=A0AAW2CLE9_9ROSI